MHRYVHLCSRCVPLSVTALLPALKLVDCNKNCLFVVPCYCLSSLRAFCLCACAPPDNDLEPGLSRAGDKEPREDHQAPHRCGLVDVFQYRWQPSRHHLQGQEGPPDGAALRIAAEGTAVCTCALLLLLLLWGQKSVYTIRLCRLNTSYSEKRQVTLIELL